MHTLIMVILSNSSIDEMYDNSMFANYEANNVDKYDDGDDDDNVDDSGASDRNGGNIVGDVIVMMIVLT